MKTKLEAGAEIDFLTADELRHELSPFVPREKPMSWSEAPTVRNHKLVSVNSAGMISTPQGDPVVIVTAALGYTYRIARLAISADGYSPSAPLTSGWLIFAIGNILVYPLPIAGQALAPLVITEGDPAQVLFGGDDLAVIGAGLPADITLRLDLQLRMRKEQ